MQLLQGLEYPLIFVVKASLVTVEESKRSVGAGKSVERQGHPAELVDFGPLLLGEAVALLGHCDVQESTLDASVAGQSPMRRDELPDQIGFRLVGGSEALHVFAELGFVFLLGLVG